MTNNKHKSQSLELGASESTREDPLSLIANAVCKHFDVSFDDFKSKSCKRPLPFIRQIYCYLAKEHTKATLSVIAAFVNRNHSTVIKGGEKIEDFIKTDRKLAKRHVADIEDTLDFSEIRATEEEMRQLMILERETLKNEKKEVLEKIANAVCDHFDVSFDDLKGKSRKRPLPFIRQIYCYLAKKNTDIGSRVIGDVINCDHTVTFYGYKTIQSFIDTNQLLAKEHVALLAHELGFVEWEDGELKVFEENIDLKRHQENCEQKLKTLFNATNQYFEVSIRRKKSKSPEMIKARSAFIVAAQKYGGIEDKDILKFLGVQILDSQYLGLTPVQHEEIANAFHVVAELKQGEPDIEKQMQHIAREANVLPPEAPAA